MNGHLHTGFVQLGITTVFVIVAIQTIRFGAAKLASTNSGATAGKVLGSLVTFS